MLAVAVAAATTTATITAAATAAVTLYNKHAELKSNSTNRKIAAATTLKTTARAVNDLMKL